MKNFRLWGLSLLLALSLSGCASRQPNIEVARYHLNKPIAVAAVQVKTTEANSASTEQQIYLNAVRNELTRLGFDASTEKESDLVAEATVTRGLQPAARKSSGFSIGIGGGTGGSRMGIGGGVSIPVGDSAREVYVTELKVVLIRLSEKAVVWEGTAKRESDDMPVSTSATVSELAAALFADFPGESGKRSVASP